jgi:hypothetical protein
MRYDVAEAIYTGQDILIAKILSTAICSLNSIDDKTAMELEALKYALKLENLLTKNKS